MSPGRSVHSPVPRLGREDNDLALASRKLVTKRLASRWLSVPVRYVATMLPKKARPTAWQGDWRLHTLGPPGPSSNPTDRNPVMAVSGDAPRELKRPYSQPSGLDRLMEGRQDAAPRVQGQLDSPPHPRAPSYLLNLHP